MAEIIYPNGETLPFEIEGDKPTLKELQDAVGGYIEVVTLLDGRLMAMDEEGKLKGYEVNHVATEMFAPGHDVVVGNVVVMNADEME